MTTVSPLHDFGVIERYLDRLTRSPGFTRFGLEYEAHVVERSGGHAVSHRALEIVDRTRRHGVVPELVDFTIELPLPPYDLNGTTFAQVEEDLLNGLRVADAAAADLGLALLCTGIPPTLSPRDLTKAALVPKVRYDRLDAAWCDALATYRERHASSPSWNGFVPSSIAVTGAAAAVQPHIELSSDPEEAGREWNAAHYATVVALAVATNSGTFLGTSSYLETRIPIWRDLDDLERGRVFFGPGWVRTADEVLMRYLSVPPLDLDDAPPQNDHQKLIRHAKSLWPYLRLIPDRAWHIENRAFACEPPHEAITTAAYYTGLANGLRLDRRLLDRIVRNVPFGELSRSFFCVARHGLAARIPHWDGTQLVAAALAAELRPVAEAGLLALGMARDDAARILREIELRAIYRTTGAHWTRNAISSHGPAEATRVLIERQLESDGRTWLVPA